MESIIERPVSDHRFVYRNHKADRIEFEHVGARESFCRVTDSPNTLWISRNTAEATMIIEANYVHSSTHLLSTTVSRGGLQGCSTSAPP